MLDDEQPASLGHDPSAAREDAQAAIVVPIVQELRQEIGVAAGRDRGEEIALDDGAAVGEPGLGEVTPRPRRHGGRLQERPVAAADVDDRMYRRDVVGLQRRRGHAGRDPRHEAVENVSQIAIAGQIVEEVRPKDANKRRLFRARRAHCVEQGAEGRVVDRAVEERRLAQRAGGVRAQRFSQRREPEASVHVLGDDPVARQRPQDAARRERGRADGVRQRVRACGPSGQQVGDAEPGRDVDELRVAVTVDHAREGGAGGVLVRPSPAAAIPFGHRLSCSVALPPPPLFVYHGPDLVALVADAWHP